MFILKKNSDFLIAYLIGGSLVLIKVFCLFMFDENEKFKNDYIYNNNNCKSNDKNIIDKNNNDTL